MNLPTKLPPKADQTTASKGDPIRIYARRDLIVVETKHSNESAIVVKDPIALKYHRLRPDEYFVLQSLKGNVSLKEVCHAYEERYMPQRVTEAQINRLLFRLHQLGLTISDATRQGDRLNERRLKDRRQKLMQHISGMLFIRFPGVDPEPFLRRVYPLIRPCLSPLAMAVALLFCCVALVLFASKWEQFAGEFPQMQEWMRLEAIFILACVLGGTKILHEIGHAVICKHFGGECHQIGPMLLVFTPALYCDTSDSWMFASRWQRAAVGLAGIGTEVLLAAIAAVIWASTGQGLVHYVAMNVMLVCSVSTLLFNANPLLRYDGYYILSDFCDVPNLGERSRKMLTEMSSKLFIGVDESAPDGPQGWGAFWMFVYASASFVYRWSLTLVILWFVSLMLRPYELESIGRVLCFSAACGVLYALIRTPVQFLRNPARRKLIKMKRVIGTTIGLVMLLVLASIPYSSGISATARIIPRSESIVYATSPGRLAKLSVRPGSRVQKGDEIATLINHSIEMQYIQARASVDIQRKAVESLRRTQFRNSEMGNELPAAQTLLRELEKQLATRKSRFDSLVIRAPATGRLIGAPHRTKAKENEDSIELRLASWHGAPTDPENENCFLSSGTELMSVATSDDWNAEIVMDQGQVDRIDVGNSVKLALSSHPSKVFYGNVNDISRSHYRADENAPRHDDTEGTRRVDSPSKRYLVSIEINENDSILYTGTTAIASVEGNPISLLMRCRRFLNSVLRFR